MQKLRTVTSLDVSAVAGHHAMPVALLFDLEKAYDPTWRYGILQDLHDLGLRGRLPVFIRSFLEDRTMQVLVGSTLSDFYDQEQGVPQGSILITTLFNIK